MAHLFERDVHGIVEVQMPIEEDWIATASEDMEMPVRDAMKTYVKWEIGHIGDEFAFEYDFSDGWEVNLTLEDVFEDNELPGKALPRVISGWGYGIIEDCGGVYGLREIEMAFNRGKGPDYDRYSSWLGVDSLDLEAFDIGDMNFRLKKVPRIYRDIYEKGLMPTQRAMNILSRGMRNRTF